MTAIALIPARGGSKRVKGKNIRNLAGHPLIAYTIRAALDSGCFSKVLVSSDDVETLDIAAAFGADVVRRPDGFATDTSPDIDWVKHALNVVLERHQGHVDGRWLEFANESYDTFAILRPTSPFRMPLTIKRAFKEWQVAHDALRGSYTSLRALEPVSQHPGKMWYVRSNEAIPMFPQPAQPFHDSQMASLPHVWTQNASLEIAWTKTVEESGTISGGRVLPFLTEGYEGFDVNTEHDWQIAEQMVKDGVELPDVKD